MSTPYKIKLIVDQEWEKGYLTSTLPPHKIFKKASWIYISEITDLLLASIVFIFHETWRSFVTEDLSARRVPILMSGSLCFNKNLKNEENGSWLYCT